MSHDGDKPLKRGVKTNKLRRGQSGQTHGKDNPFIGILQMEILELKKRLNRGHSHQRKQPQRMDQGSKERSA